MSAAAVTVTVTVRVSSRFRKMVAVAKAKAHWVALKAAQLILEAEVSMYSNSKSHFCAIKIFYIFLSEAFGISFCLFTRPKEWMDVRRVQLILNLACIGFSKVVTTP